MFDRPQRGGQPANREELLKLAINAAEHGNKQAARVMFRQVLAQNKRDERALMWMAKLAESKDERRLWLNRVLAVNPSNEIARRALQKMAYTGRARDNRILLTFGVLVVVLIVLAVVIFLVPILTQP